MQKFTRNILFASAAAAAVLAGCSDDPTRNPDVSDTPPVGPTQSVEADFGANQAELGSPAGTNAVIDVGAAGFTGAWESGDPLCVGTVAPDGSLAASNFEYDPQTGSFKGTLPRAISGSWTYYACYPYSSAAGSGYTAIPFGAARTQKGNAFNSLYDAQVADGVSVTGEAGKNPDGSMISFSMHRITSIMYFELSGSALPQTEKVKSVKLTADRNIASDLLFFNYSNAGFTYESASPSLGNDPSAEIVMTYQAGTEPTVADFRAFFNILPAHYRSLTIEVVTEQHRVSFTVRPTKEFAAGTMYAYRKDIADWRELWSIGYNNDADLWKNTASLTAEFPAEATVPTVRYRVKGTTAWKNASTGLPTDYGSYKGLTANLAATWKTGANEKGNTVYTPDNTTGVFAKKTYQCELLSGGTVMARCEFTPSGNGDVIEPFAAGMSCFTSSNTAATFWGSGNNTFASKLCQYDATYSCAVLAAIKPIMLVDLAPGNLFTGTFQFGKPSFGSGTVGFGQKYVYTARPTALKLRIKATIGTVNSTKHGSVIPNGQQDEASLMVCIVDWAERHSVASGQAAPTGVWDPVTKAGLSASEKIIGYAVQYPNATTADFVDVTMPIQYYDKDAAAPAGNYTIVLSFATSRYGDYLNGCNTNKLYVADLEWVY